VRLSTLYVQLLGHIDLVASLFRAGHPYWLLFAVLARPEAVTG
jgi:hypothetical protein